MQSKLYPYLNFQDNTREAMEFYHTVFGGKLELHTLKPCKSGEVSHDHTSQRKVY